MQKREQQEDAYIQLARQAVEAHVRTGKLLPVPAGLPEEM